MFCVAYYSRLLKDADKGRIVILKKIASIELFYTRGKKDSLPSRIDMITNMNTKKPLLIYEFITYQRPVTSLFVIKL